MTVDEIIEQVRFCIDEESSNSSSLADTIDEKDDSYMDNIIKAKIPDALHWIAITAASSSVLSSSTTSSKTDNSDKDSSSSKTEASVSVEMTVADFDTTNDIGLITMPSNISVFNINRVRAKGWHKAVIPVEDTSDEALFMYDESSKGTNDRPQAAIMRTTPLQILVQPKPDEGTVEVSYVGVPTGTTSGDGGKESVDISENFRSSFIYYIAFLLLSAYDDTKANQMYNIALQMLGANQTK